MVCADVLLSTSVPPLSINSSQSPHEMQTPTHAGAAAANPTNAASLPRPQFVPVILGQQLLEGYERNWHEIHRRTAVLARYAKHVTQQTHPLHEWWHREADEYKAFQKEAALLQTEIIPAVNTLTIGIKKITTDIQSLEAVLILALEQKEERTKEAAKVKKEKELAEQKNRFLTTYKATEAQFLGDEFAREKSTLEASLQQKERQLQKEIAERMEREKKQVEEQLEKAKLQVQMKYNERVAVVNSHMVNPANATTTVAPTTAPAPATSSTSSTMSSIMSLLKPKPIVPNATAAVIASSAAPSTSADASSTVTAVAPASSVTTTSTEPNTDASTSSAAASTVAPVEPTVPSVEPTAEPSAAFSTTSSSTDATLPASADDEATSSSSTTTEASNIAASIVPPQTAAAGGKKAGGGGGKGKGKKKA